MFVLSSCSSAFVKSYNFVLKKINIETTHMLPKMDGFCVRMSGTIPSLTHNYVLSNSK